MENSIDIEALSKNLLDSLEKLEQHLPEELFTNLLDVTLFQPFTECTEKTLQEILGEEESNEGIEVFSFVFFASFSSC